MIPHLRFGRPVRCQLRHIHINSYMTETVTPINRRSTRDNQISQEQATGLEPISPPWQGGMFPVTLYLRKGKEVPVSFPSVQFFVLILHHALAGSNGLSLQPRTALPWGRGPRSQMPDAGFEPAPYWLRVSYPVVRRIGQSSARQDSNLWYTG